MMEQFIFICPADAGFDPPLLFIFFKVLEKMRPLDHKLKYQIDKLVRTAVTGSLGKLCDVVCDECTHQWSDF